MTRLKFIAAILGILLWANCLFGQVPPPEQSIEPTPTEAADKDPLTKLVYVEYSFESGPYANTTIQIGHNKPYRWSITIADLLDVDSGDENLDGKALVEKYCIPEISVSSGKYVNPTISTFWSMDGEEEIKVDGYIMVNYQFVADKVEIPYHEDVLPYIIGN